MTISPEEKEPVLKRMRLYFSAARKESSDEG